MMPKRSMTMRRRHPRETLPRERTLRNNIVFFVAIVALLSLPSATQAEPMLKQLHVITRHGSRRPLAKDAMTLDETPSETSLLTPLGQQQLFELGSWLRARYYNANDHDNGFAFGSSVLAHYDPNQVRVESSDLHRTLTSASSLLLGLFPSPTRGLPLSNGETPANIPVYSKQLPNDISIRAYDKCPAFHQTLETLYQSQEWNTLEQEQMPLLQQLAQMEAFQEYVYYHENEQDNINNGNNDRDQPFKYIPLEHMWNVYDKIHVAKTECNNVEPTASDVCQNLPDPNLATGLTDNQWKAVEQLTHQLEFLRYGPSTTGTKVGGPLWDTIVRRMQQQGQQQTMPNKLYITSAHYPTLLGLFAALNLEWGDIIAGQAEEVLPDYASALLLELYQDDNDPTSTNVKVYYKPGPDASKDVIPVKISDDCPTETNPGCPLESFVQVLAVARLTPEEWCGVCGNTDADVCMKLQLNRSQQQGTTTTAPCEGNSDARSGNPATTYFAGVGTVVALVVLGALVTTYMRSTESLRQQHRQSKEVNLSRDLGDMTSKSKSNNRANHNNSPTARIEEDAASDSGGGEHNMLDGAVMA